ncbi:MAG: hypothetical protein GX647_05055 [Clostridiales bacterium]|jgi:hypothetical protein|nr:hypothetical protein [Clostridiales bacterium]
MNSKRKGNRGELELLHLLEARGLSAVRNDQTFIGGKGNPDIGLPGLHLEVKRCEALRLSDALNQAKADAEPGLLPVVMHRRNRGEWTAILCLDDFLALYAPYLLCWVKAKDRELDARFERIK